jgi:hypothetical protein
LTSYVPAGLDPSGKGQVQSLNCFKDGRAELLLADLQNLTAFPDTREDKYGDINSYFKDWYNHQVSDSL